MSRCIACMQYVCQVTYRAIEQCRLWGSAKQTLTAIENLSKAIRLGHYCEIVSSILRKRAVRAANALQKILQTASVQCIAFHSHIQHKLHISVDPPRDLPDNLNQGVSISRNSRDVTVTMPRALFEEPLRVSNPSSISNIQCRSCNTPIDKTLCGQCELSTAAYSTRLQKSLSGSSRCSRALTLTFYMASDLTTSAGSGQDTKPRAASSLYSHGDIVDFYTSAEMMPESSKQF